MIDSLNLYRKADRLACRIGTSDPEEIAKSWERADGVTLSDGQRDAVAAEPGYPSSSWHVYL